VRTRAVVLSGGILFLVIVASIILEEMTLLHVGDRAPEFSAVAQNGERVRLSDFLGRKNILLYFYPKDYTDGCTQQACTIRDSFPALSRLDAIVLGVNPDDAGTHQMFSSSYNLPYLLLSDPEKTVIRAYGAGWLGGALPWTKRVTYVIDKEGIIRAVIHHEINIGGHVQDALLSLEQLQSR